jgi:hypothetical protein
MSKQDLHAKTPCMLEDDGTLKAMEEYMTRAGELASSQGLSKAVSDYWSSLYSDADENDHTPGASQAQIAKGLLDGTAREWISRRGYRWKDLDETQ